jgi:hypothetical protein
MASRALILQQKTGRPVQFEITEPARMALTAWIAHSKLKSEDFMFPSRIHDSPHLSTRQYARIVDSWVTQLGLDPANYGTHTLRRTKATLIYRRTKNLRAVQPPDTVPSIDLGSLHVDPVLSKADSLLWNAYIERHHYLGHQPMPGAQLRYFVRAAGHIVAALSFGASAWKVKPRDQLIGWTRDQRQRNLHLVVNNARFLIMPWIQCKNLASRILALVSRRLPDDWHARYAYRPVLLETFVEKPRFSGTCYKAANWRHLGDTQGRGKLDVLHRHAQPIKSIWIYPLMRDFQRQLCNG